MAFKKAKKQRLDALVLSGGLAANAREAQGLIMAGKVVVDEARVDKPGALFLPEQEIRLKSGTSSWVSRGAFKLLGALEKWPFDLRDAVGLDVGASTGGFTQVLLEQGAQKVYAVDVGYGQLAWSLRLDSRVENLERTHIARLRKEQTPLKANCCVIDVSFTSLLNVIPFIAEHIKPECKLYALIKPQFEIGRHDLEKGGIIRDDKVRESVRDDVISRINGFGLHLVGVMDSPIKGAEGNVEYMSCWTLTDETLHLLKEEANERMLHSNGESS